MSRRQRQQGEEPVLYIDLPTRAEIEALAAHRGAPAVSIYLRTTPVTRDTDVDRIELKNQLKAAVAELEAAETPKRSIWPIEQAVEALIGDDGFWATQAHSLAIFVTPESIRTFRLPNQLTGVVEVSDRFHIKPLLRAVTFPQNAFVLAIGMGAVRLVEVDADLPPAEVKVQGLPKDMADALGRRSHGPRTGPGTSGEEQSEHALLTRYARTVDQALRPILSGHGRPLIVAATEPLASVYRAVSTYPHTAAEVIGGAADRTPDQELAAAARNVLDGIYAGEIDDLAALFAQREPQGRAVTDVAQAARAATFGAIDTLIVDMDAVVPGTVDDESGAVAFGEGGRVETYGVVDEIARRTLLNGGRVVSARRADIPGGGDLAAVLRYPV
jgi:hypothetical protein